MEQGLMCKRPRRLSASERRELINWHLDNGKQVELTAEQFNVTLGQVYACLSSPVGKELSAEVDILEDLFAAFSKAELGLMYIDAYNKLAGNTPVRLANITRDGELVEHEVRKFFPADLRALLADLSRIAGIFKPTETNVKVSGTIEYRSNVPPSALNVILAGVPTSAIECDSPAEALEHSGPDH